MRREGWLTARASTPVRATDASSYPGSHAFHAVERACRAGDACWTRRAASVVFPVPTGGVSYRWVQSLVQVPDQGHCDGSDRERWCWEDATDSQVAWQPDGGGCRRAAERPQSSMDAKETHHPWIERLHVRGFRSLADVKVRPVAGRQRADRCQRLREVQLRPLLQHAWMDAGFAAAWGVRRQRGWSRRPTARRERHHSADGR